MLNGPWGVAVNDRDQIAVAELFNHRVSVFRSDGERKGGFNQPSGIAFDSHANSERSEFLILSRGKRGNRKQSAIRL